MTSSDPMARFVASTAGCSAPVAWAWRAVSVATRSMWLVQGVMSAPL
uniref:Uncharacterized protein n=1 Tax=Arundo donax TaxID=35708 RepID=A0A0A9BQA2_ARUDO